MFGLEVFYARTELHPSRRLAGGLNRPGFYGDPTP